MPQDPSDAEAEIRALWEKASAALCQGDWLSYQELWAHTEYVEIIHPDANDWKIGWEAIGPAYRDLLATDLRCECETRSMRVRVAPEGTMAWATAEVVIRTAEPPLLRTLWQTLVFERPQGRWKLVHGHASIAGQHSPV